jgi:hypothetical protein
MTEYAINFHIHPTTNEFYQYFDHQVRVFDPGESSFPIERATMKEKGEDYGDDLDE